MGISPLRKIAKYLLNSYMYSATMKLNTMMQEVATEKKLKVVIADNSAELCGQFAEAVQGNGRFTVIGLAYDGVQAMELVKEHHPDILVLDLMLPECDGLAVLKAIGDMDNKPGVIMTSSFVTNFVAYKAEDLGARILC